MAAGAPTPTQEFVARVRTMLGEEGYLFPYAWAQRLFRSDNYQMASQAALEDMFYDTFGDFLRRRDPACQFDRRTGSEPWDYRFQGQGLSHKESQAPLMTAVWQAGDGPGNRTPKWPTWNFQHPVVFTYTPDAPRVPIEADVTLPSGRRYRLARTATPVSPNAMARAGMKNAYVLLGKLAGQTLTVDAAWRRDQWEQLTVPDLLQLTAGQLLETNFWLVTLTAQQTRIGVDLLALPFPWQFHVGNVPHLPGVYLFEHSWVQNLPLSSNNKAHFVYGADMEALMDRARVGDTWVPLPLWPAVFADTTPPNLYQEQKKRFDALFAARVRP